MGGRFGGQRKTIGCTLGAHGMNESLVALGTVGFGTLFFFVQRWLKDKTLTVKSKQYNMGNLLFRLMSALLFLLFIPHLFTQNNLSYMTLNAKTVADGHLVMSAFPAATTVLLMILRWFSAMTLATVILLPFYDKETARDFTALVGPIFALLNAIFFRTIMTSYIGSWQPYHWRTVIYACLVAFAGALSVKELIALIVEKRWQNIGKRLGRMGLYVLFYLMAFMPVYGPQLCVGYIGQKTSGFVLTHRLLIYLTVLFPFAVYFLMRKKSYEERRYMLMMLALSGFIQYFVWQSHRSGLTSLPLHLCNTAIALMFFAYAFRLKGVFYFTYLVNIMGALMAIILPNTTGELTKGGNIVFWYNHIYAVVLPFLGVALRVFERPNIKLMYKAIAAFAVYVLAAATLDGWLNNSPLNTTGSEVDYFFLYSTFFTDKFAWAIPIKENFVWTINVSADTKIVYFWLYDITVFVIAVALMFVMWGVYGITYKVGDRHQELARRKRLRKIDQLNLLKELDGRSPKEPLNPEGVDMIRINHFSKTYAGSNRKAVDDITLEINDGEVFGFIGHNGAGKSTTIKSMVGIQTITEGSIEIDGYDIARQPMEAKLRIGYVSDNHAVYEKLTGREYVSYVADLYMVSEEDKAERLAHYAQMFGIEDALDREIKGYSHGMKQKIMVISALIHNPKVWVLDEPLTGLDPTSAYQIKECMREHANAGNVVFFSSHVIEVVEKICDRVAIISGGKLCRVCTAKEIHDQGLSLEQIYLQYAQESERNKSDKYGEHTETENADAAVDETAALAEAAADQTTGEATEAAEAEETNEQTVEDKPNDTTED